MSDQGMFTRLPAIARRLLPGALLILPGCTFIGVAVGQMVGDPSNWTTVGMGLGVALWGLSLSWSRSSS